MSAPGNDLLSEIENGGGLFTKLGVYLRSYLIPTVQQRGLPGQVYATPPDKPGDSSLQDLKTLIGQQNPVNSAYVGTNNSGQIIAAATPTSGFTELTGDVNAGPGSGSQAATLNTGVVGWDVPAGAGLVASPAGNIQAAIRAYPISKCIVTVTSSDATTDLMFDILQNGTSIFTAAQTIPHGTASGTVLTLGLKSASLPVAFEDTFAMNITAGTATWAFTMAVR